MKNKKNIITDYQQMIYKSWTYGKMTPQEKHQWAEVLDNVQTTEALKGSYNQRWEILQAIYNSYIIGLGCNGWNWREESESTFQMIKFIKIVDYYQRKKPLRSTESKKQEFAIFEDAFNALINENLAQVVNDKDITAIESCCIIYRDKPGHYKKITKTIDPNNPNEYIIK